MADEYDYVPAEQTVSVTTAKPWMERTVEVSVTTHQDDRHEQTTRIHLTPFEARSLIAALTDYLESR